MTMEPPRMLWRNWAWRIKWHPQKIWWFFLRFWQTTSANLTRNPLKSATKPSSRIPSLITGSAQKVYTDQNHASPSNPQPNPERRWKRENCSQVIQELGSKTYIFPRVAQEKGKSDLVEIQRWGRLTTRETRLQSILRSLTNWLGSSY